MTEIYFRDQPIHTFGSVLQLGTEAPNFLLTKTDLSTVTLENFSGKALLINVYPSIDTQVCFESVKKFSRSIKAHAANVEVLCVSMDLPFALRRISEAEGLDNVTMLSDFRNRDFGALYGLTIIDGPLAGLLARSVIVLDPQHRTVYQELVKDVTQPPNYQAALAMLVSSEAEPS